MRSLISEAVNRKISHLLLVGDYNLKLIDWETWSCRQHSNDTSCQEEKFITCLENNYLHQHQKDYTRFREGQQPSCLDLVITNEEEMVHNITRDPPLGKSDHVMLDISLSLYAEHTNVQTMRYRLDKGNYPAMRTRLQSINWEEELRDKNVDASWRIFRNHMQKAMDQHIPCSRIKGKTRPMWINADMQRAIKSKDQAS
jgi:hypothetical protein